MDEVDQMEIRTTPAGSCRTLFIAGLVLDKRLVKFVIKGDRPPFTSFRARSPNHKKAPA